MPNGSGFSCERCGAALALPRDSSEVDVLCAYCETRTPVPLGYIERLQGNRPRRIARPPAAAALAIGGLVALLSVAGIVVGFAARRPVAPAARAQQPEAPATVRPSSAPLRDGSGPDCHIVTYADGDGNTRFRRECVSDERKGLAALPTGSPHSCDPPYYVDSAGHRQAKPACL